MRSRERRAGAGRGAERRAGAGRGAERRATAGRAAERSLWKHRGSFARRRLSCWLEACGVTNGGRGGVGACMAHVCCTGSSSYSDRSILDTSTLLNVVIFADMALKRVEQKERPRYVRLRRIPFKSLN